MCCDYTLALTELGSRNNDIIYRLETVFQVVFFARVVVKLFPAASNNSQERLPMSVALPPTGHRGFTQVTHVVVALSIGR